MIKRILTTLLAIGLVVAPLTATGANAETTPGGHTADSVENLQVGTYYDLNYQCVESDPNVAVDTPVTAIGWADTPVVPAGMTVDLWSFHIYGTPTEVGDFPLPDVVCHFMGLNGFWDESRAAGKIVVSPAPPAAAPSLKLFSTRDLGCKFYLAFSIPAGVIPDSSSQTVEINFDNNPGRPWIYHGVNQKTDSMFQIDGGKMDQNPVGDDWVQTQADWSNIAGTVNFTAYYSVNGVKSNEFQFTGRPSCFSPERLEAWKEVYTPDQGGCFVHIGYTLSAEPDYAVSETEGGVFLTYTEPDSNYTATFRIKYAHYMSNDDIWFSITNGAITDSEGGLTSVESISGTSRGCYSTGRVKLDFNSNGERVQSSRGVVGISLCGKGTYSPSGYDWVDDICEPADFGSYIDFAGATHSTPCPAGQTTDQLASASIWDCYTPQIQTMKKLSSIKVVKLASTITVAAKTDQGQPVKITAIGACRAIQLSIKGVMSVKITAAKVLPKGKKFGLCKLTMGAPAGNRNLQFNKTISFKVTKTGK